MDSSTKGRATDRATEDSPSPQSHRSQWALISVLFLFYALAYLDKKLITFLIVPIRQSLGASDFQMSLVTGSAFVLFYVLFSLPIGWAVDRYSRRGVIFTGVLIWSLAAAAGGLANNIWQLMLARTGVGAGEAVLGPAGNSMVADSVAKDRLTFATAATHAGVLLGSALAFGLGGLLLAFVSDKGAIALPLLGEVEAWQSIMLITGLPGVALAFLIFLIREPTRRDRLATAQPPSAAGAFVFMRKNIRFYGLHFTGFSLISVCMAGFAGWMPTHMMRTYDVPVAQLGGILAALQLSFGALGMFLPAFIVDRLFRSGRTDAHMRVFAWAVLVMGLAGLLVGLAPTATLAFGGIVMVDAMAGFLPVAGAALQLTTPNEYRGQITAAFLIAYNVIGQGLGPVLVASITDYGFGQEKMVGASIAITFVIAAPLAALCLFAGMRSMRAAVSRIAATQAGEAPIGHA